MEAYSQAQPNELRSQAARSLLLRLFNDLGAMVKQEYQLVKTEVVQKRGLVRQAAFSLGFASAIGLLAATCLTVAIVAELAIPLGLPLAALIVGVAYGIIAAILGFVFRRMLVSEGLAFSHATGQLPKPLPTTKTLDEQEADLAWTRRRIEETLTALERKSDLGTPLRDAAVGMGALSVAVANIVRAEAKTRS
jgi:hypothetical protein